MYTITYNLRGSDELNDAFYDQLHIFSSEIFSEMDEVFYEAVQSYFRFRRHSDLEEVYTLEEAYLELLSLGVFWVIYSGDALASKEVTNDLLSKMFELRENNRHLKPIVDAFRGICLTTMMSPDLYDHMGVATPSMGHLDKLLDWLEATGEFKYESHRLRYWEAYLKTCTDNKQKHILEDVISAGLWFEKDSLLGLGEFTACVDRYLNEVRPKRYYKEDVIFCGRRRVEYHLNMVGAEWLNRANRKAFELTKKKVVILPTCLRITDNEGCKAILQGEWLKCNQCRSDCAVCEVEKLGSDLGADVYMIAHNSSFENGPEGLDFKEIGVVGVACVLNLISGGWMLSEHQIPAQCVLLEYCGCKAHWHHEGIPTALDLNELRRILK